MPHHSGRTALDGCIRDAFGQLQRPRDKAVLADLVARVRAGSDLLSQRRSTRSGDPNPTEVLEVLPRFARMRPHWIRPLWEWRPIGASRLRQFRSLVDHLFAEHPVPAFVAHALLGNTMGHIPLYAHLARGGSVRTAPGYQFTRTGAHHFANAPDDLAVHEAVLWSRLRERRAEPRLARRVIEADRDNLIPVVWYDDEFWLNDLIPFLVREWPIDRDELFAIIEFARRQRYDDADDVWGHGAGEGPLRPDLTFRGRTLQSVRRMMLHWREDLAATMAERMTVPGVTWPAVGIGGFSCVEPDDRPRRWTIRELLTDRDLRIEGARMQHCVATFIDECARRSTTIWSMEVELSGRVKPALTIEVNPTNRRIITALGRYNAGPTTIQRTILRRWANQQSLEIGSV